MRGYREIHRSKKIYHQECTFYHNPFRAEETFVILKNVTRTLWSKKLPSNLCLYNIHVLREVFTTADTQRKKYGIKNGFGITAKTT